MSFTTQPVHTFNERRECLQCKNPIPDQEHANTKFCHRDVLTDGSIKSCKDDFHSLKNKEKNSPYLRIANYHKDANHRIQKLLLDKGETVTLDQINQYGIRLDMPVQLKTNIDQKSTFYFTGFCLTQISQSTLKITTHENSF